MTMPNPKRRGRPRSSSSPQTAAADSAIGRSVYQLASWGYPLRSRGDGAGACEVVALEARRILNRADSDGRALGPDRVEQIFESWFSREQEARREGRQWPLRERWRYTKSSLAERIPDKTLGLEGLAAELLRNDGRWVGRELVMPCGDLELAPKADSIMGQAPKIVGNGVEK
ncbi:hypothetical protein [Sulfuritalea hydrogenivorans]|uniref:Uncharacterized protein n=1 Tax=Sulfuritalea hydrogenivorans sk43H TaxID=1223802 RepID=W0SDT9_9PROT|nr:hypothetical protein [Sulfuritalea hydrogenivorans]BAO29374.1 hypothetical protein SUTH_01581 [Sulfuritalea hydrogenivorans sk43H]